MKKVLLVAPEGMAKGGVQAVMMSIVRNLSGLYQFDVLLFTNEKRYYEDEFLTYGGNIFRIPNYEKNNQFRRKIDRYIRGHRIYKKTLRILKENGPYAVVHCNNESEAASVLKAASTLGVPVRISHTHRVHTKGHILSTLIDRHRQGSIEKYSTCKLGCSDKACKSFFKNPDNAVVVPNAYDENRFRFTPKTANPVNGPLNLMQVGSFSQNKNQLFSIRVLSEMKKRDQKAVLTLVGFGDQYKEALISEAKRLNCLEDVRFCPSDADIPTLLGQSDVFLFPSVLEGFGIALVEAQAVGLKCYASKSVPVDVNCGGVIYLSLEDGPEAWAKQIIQDIQEGKANHQKYDCERFQTKEIVGRYKEIYQGKE